MQEIHTNNTITNILEPQLQNKYRYKCKFKYKYKHRHRHWLTRPPNLKRIVQRAKLDSETPSHLHVCARTGQGCFDQKSKRPGSIRKSPDPFGAAAFPQIPEG